MPFVQKSIELLQTEAPVPSGATAQLHYGTVTAGGDPTAIISIGDRTHVARRGFSCLIEPQPGDMVLASLSDDGAAHVIAILSRPGIGDATLSLPDPAARMRLAAQSIDIAAKVTIGFEAPNITLSTKILNLLAESSNWVGQTLTQVGRTMRRFVKSDETTADVVVTRATTRMTTIDGIDQTRIGTELTEATLSSKRGTSAVVSMRDDLRLDAERITMG